MPNGRLFLVPAWLVRGCARRARAAGRRPRAHPGPRLLRRRGREVGAPLPGRVRASQADARDRASRSSNEHTPAAAVPSLLGPAARRAATSGCSRKRDCPRWPTRAPRSWPPPTRVRVAVVPLVGPSVAAARAGGERPRGPALPLRGLPAGRIGMRVARRSGASSSSPRGRTRRRSSSRRPYRNEALLADLLASLPARHAARGGRRAHRPRDAWIRMDRIERLASRPAPAIGKRPATFLLQAGSRLPPRKG